jgi:hypothetical protein
MNAKYIQSGMDHAISYTVGKDILRVPGVHDEPNGVAVTEEQISLLEEQPVFAANIASGRYTVLDDVPQSAKTVREQFSELTTQLSDKDAQIAAQAATIAELKAKLESN